jgi:hypothetical protein
MFSDEKWFDSDGQVNRQNDRVYAQSREAATDAGGVQPEKKFPLKVMVWVGLTWNGPTEAVFLPTKTSFNHHFYRNQVLPRVKRDGLNLIGKYFWFQQDGASPHTCPATLDLIEKLNVLHISPKHWPPNSPDLNPLDFFFWNEVERRIPKKEYVNRDDLVKNIKAAIKKVPLKMIRDSIDNFRTRVSACENSKGGLIKNKHG